MLCADSYTKPQTITRALGVEDGAHVSHYSVDLVARVHAYHLPRAQGLVDVLQKRLIPDVGVTGEKGRRGRR